MSNTRREMQNLAERFRAWTANEWDANTESPSYEGLIESAGFEILVNESTGDYQGENFALLRDKVDGRLALVNWGYGSCSGCDALQDSSTIQDLEELRAGMVSGVEHFDTSEALLAKVSDPKWLDDYYTKPVEFEAKCRAALEGNS